MGSLPGDGEGAVAPRLRSRIQISVNDGRRVDLVPEIGTVPAPRRLLAKTADKSGPTQTRLAYSPIFRNFS